MIEALIAALRAERIEFTAEEIADICWLYAAMPTRAPAPQPPAPPPPVLPPTGPEPQPSTSAPPAAAPPAPQPPAPQPLAPEPQASAPAEARGDLLPGPGSMPGGRAKGVPFRVPAAVALPGALDLTRALRPLMKRVASRTQRRLDEHATVDRIAEQRIWMPVMRATPARWLEIALVVEDTFEMRPWGRTVREFQRLLGHSGAFRDVRPWRLAPAEGGGFRLSSGRGTAPRQPGELFDAAGARAILIVSDCSSPLWRDQAFLQTLKDWGARQPVAVVEVLPQRLWTSTVLRDARALRVRSPRPGAPNAKLAMQSTGVRRSARIATGTSLPILTLEKPSVAAWAATVAGVAGASAHARLFPPFTFTDAPQRTVDEAWDRFEQNASPLAKDLARLLAAAPLTLPIMRLVQRTMLPESKQVHLAEIFRSELIFPVETASDPESVRYEFKPGIRGRLLDDARASQSIGVLRAALSEFIDARTGQPLDFLALLRDPDAAGTLPLNNETKPFADVAAQVLSRMGGVYQALAERLKQGHAPKPQPIRPPLAKADQVLYGHRGPVTALAFSSGGGVLFASGSSDQTIRIHDFTNPGTSQIFICEQEIVALALSPFNGKLAACDAGGGLSIWDLTSAGSPLRLASGAPVTSIVFSPEGPTLVGCSTGELVVWDTDFGEVSRRFPRPPRVLSACSPAGHTIAESDRTNIWIRDAQTGFVVALGRPTEPLYQGERGSVTALAFSPAGHFLAAACSDAIILWSAEDGRELSRFDVGEGRIAALALSADSQLLASLSSDGTLRLWEAGSGRSLRTLAAGGIHSIAFSLTENKLAAGAEDGSILLWNLAAAAAPEKPVLTGTAATPRRIQIVNRPTPDERALTEALTEALGNAGHTLLPVFTTTPDAVVVIGRDAELGRVVNDIAAREGVEAIPLSVAGFAPGAIDFHDHARWQTGFSQLLLRLDNLQVPGHLVNVPELPAIYVRRRETFESLINWMRGDHPIAALLGAPQSGKQTLAVDFARDPATRRAFPGGIYWAPEAPPPASARTLVIDPRYEVESADRGNTWFLTIDRRGLREYPGELTVTIIRNQPLTPAEQDEIAAPCRIPDRLRTPAVSRMALLARWKRILVEFGEGPVSAWLAERPVPVEYGDVAEQFAIQCALDLLPFPVRYTLERLAPPQAMNPMMGGAPFIADSAPLMEAERYARSLDLLDPRGFLRVMVRDALLAGVGHPSAQQVADHYIHLKEAAGDAGWSGVPDDGYFLDHIASALSNAGRTGHLHDLLTDANWIARRLAGSGVEALLAEARLAGLGEAFEKIFRGSDAPSTAEEIRKRLAEISPTPQPPKSGAEFDFYVSYSIRDEGAGVFVREVAAWGGRERRFMMTPVPAPRESGVLREARALVVLLSPNYLADSAAMLELRAFLRRQELFGMTGFVVPVIFRVCEIPESLRGFQPVVLPNESISPGPAYVQCVGDVAEAIDRISSREPLPPLPYTDPAWLASVAESRGYEELLRELRIQPEMNELYWSLLTSIRGEHETWEEWFGRCQNNQSA